MSNPQTANVGLYQPTRGSDVGTWDLPVNSNTGAADSLVANVAVIPLTNSPVTLSTPPNAGSLWSGPYGSQSAVLRFTGTLTASCTVTLPRSGFWIVENLCTVGTFAVILASSAPGQVIGVPDGEAVNIYCDGTNVKFVNLGRIGEYLDLGTSTVPTWITSCTVQPYLNCDGTTFSAATYPVLNSRLGGNTLPDLRGRTRAALNQTTSRITTAGSGIDGNTLLSGGGNQLMQQHNHTYIDPGHPHNIHGPAGSTAPAGGNVAVFPFSSGAGNNYGSTDTATIGITINNAGSGTSQNMPPVTIAGLTLIRSG
jgi:hypothetical protein